MSIQRLLSESFSASLDVEDVPVLVASSSNLPARVAESSSRLYGLLVPLFPGGNVHPMTSGERREYPDCVYEIGTADSMTYEAMEIAHVVNMFVTIRAPDYGDVVEKTDAVVAALEVSSGVNVVDYSGDFEHEQSLYRVALEIEISTPSGADAEDSRSVIVLPGQCKAETSPYDGGCISQLVHCQSAIVMQASDAFTLELMRYQTRSALLGKEAARDHHPLRYHSGHPLDPGGGLAGWVDVYLDTHRIKAA